MMARKAVLPATVALWACFLREWQETARAKTEWTYRVVLAFVTVLPILLAQLAFGTTGFEASGGGHDFVGFIAFGWLVVGIAETVLLSGQGYLRWANETGVLSHVWSTPIARWIPLVGTTLFDLMRATIEAVFIFGLIALATGSVPGGFSPLAIPAMVLMLLAFWGFGVALSGVGLIWRRWTIPYLLNAVFFVMAGTTYPIAVLPWSVRWISYALPHTYVIDALRATLLDTPTLIPLAAEIAIVGVWAAVGLWGGLVLFDRLDRVAARRNMIGLF